MLEVIGILIQNKLSKEDSESGRKSIYSYFDILVERFRDTNSYVRVKVLQILSKLAERSTGASYIPINLQPKLVTMAIGRLKDKSSNVRKASIKFLTKTVECCPFTAIAQDEGRLSLAYFEGKKKNLQDLIQVGLCYFVVLAYCKSLSG